LEGLVVEGLTCAYNRGRPIVSNVSFSVEKGRLLFIIGHIGSGKTTILHCIFGSRKLLSGSVWVCYRNLLSLPRRERARIIGYVPQNLPLSDMLVIDYVIPGRYLHRRGLVYNTEDYRRAWETLEAVGLAHLALRRLRELSGGS
jgi:iron complex transport system ATP-binding protein